MTDYRFSYCFALTILLLGRDTSGNSLGGGLYAGQEFATKNTSDIADVDTHVGSPTASLAGHDGSINFFIYNGDTATADEFPYMALLGYPKPNSKASDPLVYKCGGSLISSKYVLTAAHCLSNLDESVPTRVRLGSESTRSTDAQEIAVKRTIPHPQYLRNQYYRDIGLVEFQVEATFTTRVKTISLPTKAPQLSDIDLKSSILTIGFGAEMFNWPLSEQLKKSANLNLVPTTECNKPYHSDWRLPSGIDSTLICALDPNSEKRSDACDGDSGGPLVMITGTAHTLLGVTAFGQFCGEATPSVYTSVHSYIGWIESIVWPEKTTS